DVPGIWMPLLDDAAHDKVERLGCTLELRTQCERTACHNVCVRCLDDAPYRGCIGGGEVEHFHEEPRGRADAVGERGVRIRLAQNREAVAQPEVVVVEARAVVERVPAGAEATVEQVA